MAGRKRRTAEESKAIVLEVAARRLRDQGLEGLNITGVAEEAGISHATLLHHFGSSGGMRNALSEKMTADLVRAGAEAGADARVPPEELTRNVFSALADGGHAKLLAWRAVEGDGDAERSQDVSDLFARLLATTQLALGLEDPQLVQRVIYLVAIAAIGYGLAGNVLADVLGMSEEDIESFPGWMTKHIT